MPDDSPAPAPAPSGPDRMTRVRQALQTARTEVAASAAVTAEHARRAKAHGSLMLRRKQLADRLPGEKAALGEALAAAELGDVALRIQLSELDERIRNVRAANGSFKPLEVERRGVLIRLAEPFADRDAAPPEVAGPHAAVRGTLAELADVEQKLAATGSGLLPATTAGKVRLAAGVAVPVLLLGLVGYAVFGRGAKPEPPPPAPVVPAPAPAPAAPTLITAVTDEAAIQQAVGLVVCGTRETDAGGKIRELPMSTGTAFAVTRDGVLCTNKHVVEEVANLRNAKHTLEKIRQEKSIDVVPTVWVFFGKQKQVADILHVSDKFDFAVLRVAKAPTLVFALRRDPTIPRGQKVFALGFPAAANDAMSADEALKLSARRREAKPKVEQAFLDKQFEFVLTSGHVGRMTDIDDHLWVQHDTTIHGGNSGGPLVTDDGTVIGINTLKHKAATGLSFSLSLPQLKDELEPLAPGLAWR